MGAIEELLKLNMKMHKWEEALALAEQPEYRGKFDDIGKGYVIYTSTVERLEETTANIFKPKLLTTTFEHQLPSTTINYHQLNSQSIGD